ncbi:MAG: hypothetical protein QXX99_06205 [Candidatus Bathyarchaeia archaeon]
MCGRLQAASAFNRTTLSFRVITVRSSRPLAVRPQEITSGGLKIHHFVKLSKM